MKLATGQSYCPNCGASVQQHTIFCPNCGTKIVSLPTQQQVPPSYYPATPPSQAPVSTGPYKAVIGILLVVIILLGVGLYGTTSGHFFSLTGYHYSLANPPSDQSTLPKPFLTSQVPQYLIWNSCGSGPNCTMTANGWREGSVPDTFDYYVSFTSNVSVTVYFFTMGQFVQYSVCNGDIRCVSGSYDSIPATTNAQRYTLFALGEGCADYLAIYVASGNGVMQPNVGVTYNPSRNTPTGYCLQGS